MSQEALDDANAHVDWYQELRSEALDDAIRMVNAGRSPKHPSVRSLRARATWAREHSEAWLERVKELRRRKEASE